MTLRWIYFLDPPRRPDSVECSRSAYPKELGHTQAPIVPNGPGMVRSPTGASSQT